MKHIVLLFLAGCVLVLLFAKVDAAAQQMQPPPNLKKQMRPKLPQKIKPKAPLPMQKRKHQGQQETRPSVRIPHVQVTPALEIVGSPNPPSISGPFEPITLSTGPLEIIGSPNLPKPEPATFEPMTITTSPLVIVGKP